MCYPETVKEKSEAGAPGVEIEITSEMIDAGVDELRLSERGDWPAGVVRAIFLAMEATRRGLSRKTF
jgi:hypothetical protein